MADRQVRGQKKEMIFGANVKIERLGARGEGVAMVRGHTVYVPHALPGETVRADIDGERACVSELLQASPWRIAPVCEYYGVCGGCALQVLAPDGYAGWKRNLVVEALSRGGIESPVADLVAAHGDGRRRVTLHARCGPFAANGPAVVTGFMRARGHEIIAIRHCPLFCDELAHAPALAEALAGALAELEKPLDILLTATRSGIDVDVRGAGPLPKAMRLKLADLAATLDLARLASHGEVIIERRAPELLVGRAILNPPPGAFLQATLAGELALARLVTEAAGRSGRIADLFAGTGTFALRLSQIAPVHAVENDGAALAALDRAARHAEGLKPVSIEMRDLFRRPLTAVELQSFDCVVFDPPRAGAQLQATELAASDVARVIAVSCNAQTFARDARILIDGGYGLQAVTPIDQFLYSPHVEVVGVFTRAKAKKKRRSLLG